MANDDLIASLDSHDTWGRRRANMRHEVSLPAIIIDRSVGPMACAIEDISSTGMLLSLELFMAEPGREPLKAGTRADLEFAPEGDDAPTDNVSVEVEVMWRTPVAVGVRFVNIDDALRGALRKVVAAAVASRGGMSNERREQLEAVRRRILLACRKTVQRLLPNIIWSMRSEVTKRLRAMADGATPDDARVARSEADAIDEKANAIGRTIERQFLQSYAEASDLDQTQELTVRHLASTFTGKKDGKPKLVGANVSDRNARILAIGLAAEERYKKQFFSLNVRLANVIGHPIEAESNPLVPGNACRIMWEATISHCDSPRVQRCLQQAMQQRIVPLLGELYDALEKTLDEEGAQRIFDLR
jgi:hypothetical protein